MSTKRANGQYYTLGNPFVLQPFMEWAAKAGLPDTCVLEPFAGANNIIKSLQSLGICHEFVAYDNAPAAGPVRRRDTIRRFPRGHDVCITNPPWLARNSATRRGLPFPACRYDNLYKHCLELCLQNCDHVAALVPASFLQCGLFRDRLQSYVLLHGTLFRDTENPVCLSLFGKHMAKKTKIYYDHEYKGTLALMREQLPQERVDRRVRFNDPIGELGFISFDNSHEASIRFCNVAEIRDHPIKTSSRFITRISGNFGSDINGLIEKLNIRLNNFRECTSDLFLTPFKGMRADGCYRRRMDFRLARELINAT